jgi:hypothetical protein
MENLKGQINGLNVKEAKEFLDIMNNLKGVNCNYYVREDFIEFKSVFTPIIISIITGVASGLVANVIYDFLKKKSNEGKKVSISIGSINIFQNDNKGEIENKINGII